MFALLIAAIYVEIIAYKYTVIQEERSVFLEMTVSVMRERSS